MTYHDAIVRFFTHHPVTCEECVDLRGEGFVRWSEEDARWVATAAGCELYYSAPRHLFEKYCPAALGPGAR
jgi:hypothetical protein